MMHKAHCSNPEVTLTSDASGSWGCGAFWNTNWFQYQWCPITDKWAITEQELLPIVIASAIWGPQWANKSVSCLCDNEAVVFIINSGTSRDPTVMSLLRCLHFITAKFNLFLTTTHLPGSNNLLADALSRNNLSYFFDNLPQANSTPCQIPPTLLTLLVQPNLDWTSQSWNKMFNTTFSQLCHPAQSALMPPATRDSSIFATAQACSHTQHPNQRCASSQPSLASSTQTSVY